MDSTKQDNTPAAEFAKQSTHFSSKTERTQNSRGRPHDRRSGTGYVDTEKKGGRGAHNWGNELEDWEMEEEPLDFDEGVPK